MKNSITYLFIILFLSIKMIGLHALTHEDDKNDTHCEICDHAVINDSTPLATLSPQEFLIENTELIIGKPSIKRYRFINSYAIANDQLFCRPPPFTL